MDSLQGGICSVNARIQVHLGTFFQVVEAVFEVSEEEVNLSFMSVQLLIAE